MLVALDLNEAPVLVVGGGRVAARRVAALVDAGAAVTVVSPGLDADLRATAGQDFAWRERVVDLDGDLAAPWQLVVCTVDDPLVDTAVVAAAKARGLWVSSAHGGGNVRHVAQRQHGPLRLAVDSGGRSPSVAADLADQLLAAAQAAIPAARLHGWERDGWPRSGAGGGT